MKNKKYFSTLLAVLAVGFLFSFQSCKKDDDGDAGGGGTAVTKAGLLTSGGWILKSMEADFPAPIGTMDMYALMDECDKDDIMTFKSDKTTLGDEGATKCDPNDPQTTGTGTWELTSNDTQLEVTEDGETTVMTITSLTSDELLVEVTEYDSSIMANLTMRIGFKH